jgi:hypothetical protein
VLHLLVLQMRLHLLAFCQSFATLPLLRSPAATTAAVLACLLLLCQCHLLLLLCCCCCCCLRSLRGH